MKTLQEVFDEVNHADVFFGAQVDSVNTTRFSGETPLHIVANWGDAEAILILVQNGADINKRGEDGFTPLHFAAEQNRLDAVKCLVSLGAANLMDDDGDTPLKLARVLGHNEIVQFLEEHGF
jgi:ankyrin repeat protein